MREMRLKKREITDPEILREILESCEVVRIGAMDEEGMFIVPMNYGYDVREEDGTLHVCLYLHGAKEGRKAAAFAADPRVAVEMDYNHEVITGDYTCAYSYAYRSIMGNGTITEVTDPEAKKKGLGKIMAHIAPEAKIAFLPEMVERVAVWRIDLITGFLGSGKTTFLKQYAKYLMAQGKNIGILENDFGAVNVDMLLLQELRGDQCELEMISGGCDKETHRRRFRTKLISMGMSGYDRILVEPSGIYDVDEFFDTLYDEPLNRWYEAGSVITILDAGLDEKLSEEEEYLLASEAANAGKIVLSKVQNVSEEKKEETIAHLNRTLEQAGCRRQFSDAEILQKNWDDLTEDDFKMLSECSYRSEDYRKLDFGEQQTFDSLCFLEPKITEEALKKAAEAIFADPSCGNVFRIKGIVKTGETVWSEINATREQMTFQAVPESQEVLIVIGAGLSKERISGILGIE